MIHKPDPFHRLRGPAAPGAGPLAEVALAVKQALEPAPAADHHLQRRAPAAPIDLDLRGTERRDRCAACPTAARRSPNRRDAQPAEPRGRGRPKLGVVAREVTLLPRHWEWLGAQPGGASVALRKLVDEARRASGDQDRAARGARRRLSLHVRRWPAISPDFEEASRALFADDRRRFAGLDRRLARRYPRPHRQARLQRSHRAAVAALSRGRIDPCTGDPLG